MRCERITPSPIATSRYARARKILRHEVRILCVDDDGRLVGVISLSDIAQHQTDDAAQTLKNLSTREVRA